MFSKSQVLLVGWLLFLGAAAPADEGQPPVIACDGIFHDHGITTPEHTLYRIDNENVQVWNTTSKQWLYYVCFGGCIINRDRVFVSDGYTTSERGSIHHVFDLKRRTGTLEEQWTVGDNLLKLVGKCAAGVDPAPKVAGLLPSTRRGDLSIRAISHGLPLPIPRGPFEYGMR